jgi:hypothetical protein
MQLKTVSSALNEHDGVGQAGRAQPGRALTASPISSSRIRTASKTRPSDRSPRCRWERLASIAAWMSASRCRPGRSQGYQVTAGPGADAGLEITGWDQVDLAADDDLQFGLHPAQAE